MTVRDQILQLPKTEKLVLFEALWEDLNQDANDFGSPSWHRDVLAEREKLVREGGAQFISVDEARAELEKRRNG